MRAVVRERAPSALGATTVKLVYQLEWGCRPARPQLDPAEELVAAID